MRSNCWFATGSHRSPQCTVHATRCMRLFSHAAATERSDRSTAVTVAAPARAAANASAPMQSRHLTHDDQPHNYLAGLGGEVVGVGRPRSV